MLACLGLWEDAGSQVAAQLAAVGVRTRLLSVASDPDLDAAIEERAHAYIWAWIADFPDPGLGFLNTVLLACPWLYRDEALEESLKQAASLPDQDRRLRIYRDFERIWIGERAAVVPLAYGESSLWRRPWVTGMWANALARSTFAHAIVDRPLILDAGSVDP